MTDGLLRAMIVALLCLTLVLPAAAFGHIPTGGEVAGIIVGMGAVVTVLVIVVYRATHHQPSLTGCVTAQASGVALQTDNDRRMVPLTGSTGDLRVGEHVKLQGKKHKDGFKDGFEVQKLAKDLGPCRP